MVEGKVARATGCPRRHTAGSIRPCARSACRNIARSGPGSRTDSAEAGELRRSRPQAQAQATGQALSRAAQSLGLPIL